MLKMKIIDLLNKIANGEEVPKKIKYRDDVYIHIDNYCYYCNETNLILSDRIFAEKSRLNDTVEILEEENKIEKLYHCCMESDNEEIKFLIKNINDLSDKFNEIIDKINKLKEK